MFEKQSDQSNIMETSASRVTNVMNGPSSLGFHTREKIKLLDVCEDDQGQQLTQRTGIKTSTKTLKRKRTEKSNYKLIQKHVMQQSSDTSSVFDEEVNSNNVMYQSTKKQFLREVMLEQSIDDVFVPQQTVALTPFSPQFNQILDLNLRLANIKEIQESIFHQNLFIKTVDLRNNRLEKVPESICDLPYLLTIRLDYNYIVKLPAGIGTIPKLETLTASQNRLKTTPSKFQISRTSKIQVIHLNDNQIETISGMIGELPELKSLLLHNNQFCEVPVKLSKLKNLSEFSLDWFSYQFTEKQIPKLQKDLTGKIVIENFIRFLSLSQDLGHSHATFLHFFMFFHQLKELNQIEKVKFGSKERNIVHLLSLNGNLCLLKYLFEKLNHQIDINAVDNEDSTPLVLAIKNKRKGVFKYLLSLPYVNINRASLKYGSPIHLAIVTHEYKLSKKLILSGESYRFIDLNVQCKDGNNAIHYLFMNYNINSLQSRRITEMLIEKGVDVNLRNSSDFTPLHLALLNSQYDALQFALDYCKEMKTKRDSGPLFSFNLQGGPKNQSLLHLAVQNSNFKFLLMLLSSEERFNLSLVDDDGNTAKDYCPYNSPIYKLLIRYETRQIYHAQPTQSLKSSQNTDHFCLNRRHFESPTKTRKKTLEQQRLRPHLSQSIRRAREENNLSLSSAVDHDARLERQRVLSVESNLQIGQMFSSQNHNESYYGVDEFSNLDLFTPPNRGHNHPNSNTIKVQNLRPDILSSKRKASMKPRVVQIGSNISSPNVSINENKQMTVRTNEKPEDEEGNVEEENNDDALNNKVVNKQKPSGIHFTLKSLGALKSNELTKDEQSDLLKLISAQLNSIPTYDPKTSGKHLIQIDERISPQANQEQGEQFNDNSNLFSVLEDSIGISPLSDTNQSPRLQGRIQQSNDLSSRLKNECDKGKKANKTALNLVKLIQAQVSNDQFSLQQLMMLLNIDVIESPSDLYQILDGIYLICKKGKISHEILSLMIKDQLKLKVKHGYVSSKMIYFMVQYEIFNYIRCGLNQNNSRAGYNSHREQTFDDKQNPIAIHRQISLSFKTNGKQVPFQNILASKKTEIIYENEPINIKQEIVSDLRNSIKNHRVNLITQVKQPLSPNRPSQVALSRNNDFYFKDQVYHKMESILKEMEPSQTQKSMNTSNTKHNSATVIKSQVKTSAKIPIQIHQYNLKTSKSKMKLTTESQTERNSHFFHRTQQNKAQLASRVQFEVKNAFNSIKHQILVQEYPAKESPVKAAPKKKQLLSAKKPNVTSNAIRLLSPQTPSSKNSNSDRKLSVLSGK